jgi:hypothetical protein
VGFLGAFKATRDGESVGKLVGETSALGLCAIFTVGWLELWAVLS